MTGPTSERHVAPVRPLATTYQLTVCSVPKLVWFRNAKVGTRTILKLLRKAPVEFEIEHGYNVPFDAERYRAYFKFAMVRNPWDRFVSGWKNKVCKRGKGFVELTEEQIDAFQDFGKFVDFVSDLDLDTCNIHFRRQSSLIEFGAIDHLGRFECFEDEIRTIFSELGLDLPDRLPHANRSQRDVPYPDYYTPRTRDLIGHMYHKDIESFDYRFAKP